MRVADETAFYALPEGQHGLFVGGGASVRLPRIVGVHRMADLMLTGRRLNAVEAQQLGISTYLTEAGQGLGKAIELAARIATNAPITNFAVLHALPRIVESPTASAYLMESLMAAVAQGSDDAKDRMIAFLAGRRERRSDRGRRERRKVRHLHVLPRGSTAPPGLRTSSRWLASDGRVDVGGYDELWRWSTTSLEDFWQAVWDYFGVRSSADYDCVLASRVMPGAQWFPGARMNYAEHMFGSAADPTRTAIIGRSQTRGGGSSDPCRVGRGRRPRPSGATAPRCGSW